MIFKDYYKILELTNEKATAEQIKQAYREQAKKYHPDINTKSQFAEERFKDINEAYKVLSEPTSRRKYDRMWNTHVGRKRKVSYEESTRENGSIFSDFFNMFFGESNKGNIEEKETPKSKKVAIKGENVETEIGVSIFDAFYGVEKKISLRTLNGKMKTFSVKIPSGIRNYEKIRLLGQGKPGENGGKPGDLLIRIHIQNDETYTLEGVDIATKLFLTPWEAALGTKVTVNSIDEEVALYVPQGTQSGEEICIPEKGYKNGKGGRGKLIAKVCIMIPRNMTSEEKKLFEQLNKISKFNPRKLYKANTKNEA